MDNYGTEVKLLAVTHPGGHCIADTSIFPQGDETGEQLIEYAGRLCYNLEYKRGTNPNWIQERIKDGHESILEHASATFYIRASRVLTHELVRHRIASYSQRSQRYVNESEPRYITPPELINIGLVDYQFNRLMDIAWKAYRYYVNTLKVPREIARYVLPSACKTQIVMTMNFRELRHFIKLRTSKRALPEMQEVAGKVRDICKEIALEVFTDV